MQPQNPRNREEAPGFWDSCLALTSIFTFEVSSNAFSVLPSTKMPIKAQTIVKYVKIAQISRKLIHFAVGPLKGGSKDTYVDCNVL